MQLGVRSSDDVQERPDAALDVLGASLDVHGREQSSSTYNKLHQTC